MSSSSTSSVVILSPKSPVISRQTGRPLPPPPPPPCLVMAMKTLRRSRSGKSSSASRSRSRSKSHSRSSKDKKRSRKSRRHTRTRKSKRSSHRSSSLRKSKKSYRRPRSRSHEAARSHNDSNSVSYSICYSRGTEEVIRLILDPNNVKIPRRLEEGIKPIFDREELKNRRRIEIDYEADDVAPIRPLPNQSVSLIPSTSKKDYKWDNDLYSPDTTLKFSRGPSSSKRSRSYSSDYKRNKGCKRRYKSRSRSRSSSVSLEKTAKELSKILSIKPGACWACQKVGHKWKDCRNRQDKGRQKYYSEIYCSYCNRQGHLTEHCGTKIWNVARSAQLAKALLLERIKQEENENLEPGEIPSSPVSEKEKPAEVMVPGSDKVKTESLLEAEAVKMDKDWDEVTCWESEQVERVDRKSNFPYSSSTSRQSNIPESGRWVHDKFEELE